MLLWGCQTDRLTRAPLSLPLDFNFFTFQDKEESANLSGEGYGKGPPKSAPPVASQKLLF
jgi:hypothetical protein